MAVTACAMLGIMSRMTGDTGCAGLSPQAEGITETEVTLQYDAGEEMFEKIGDHGLVCHSRKRLKFAVIYK